MRVLPRVIVIGAGFGGLQCARKLRDEPVDVVLVDRQNYHLFTPLLYQVASCLLSPAEIAAPLRKVFRGASNVRVRQGEVAHIDFDAKQVHLGDGDVLEYDYVVVAAGSRVNYFGNDDLAKHSLGLKDLEHALQLRNHVLTCLERASVTADDEERQQPRQTRRLQVMSFVLVDGAAHRALHCVGRVEAHVPLIQAERIPDAIHHVADADDSRKRNGIEEAAHCDIILCGGSNVSRRRVNRRLLPRVQAGSHAHGRRGKP